MKRIILILFVISLLSCDRRAKLEVARTTDLDADEQSTSLIAEEQPAFDAQRVKHQPSATVERKLIRDGRLVFKTNAVV